MAIIPVMWSRLLRDFDVRDNEQGTDPWINWPYCEHPYVHLCRSRHPCQHIRKKQKPMEDKWKHNVEIGEFNPEQVKVKVENGKVVIHAKYTDGTEEWGDTVEKKRTVQIPENVDSEKIHSFMKSDGTLVLEAPFVVRKEESHPLTMEDQGAIVLSDNRNTLMEMDVSNFNPEEVTITCKNDILTVNGERKRSEDGQEIREYFFRQMTIPKSVKQENIKCFKGDDGKLTIRIVNPELEEKEEKNED